MLQAAALLLLSGPTGVLALEDVTLIDGTGAPPRPATVVVEGDRIRSVGAPGATNVPAGAVRIAGRGRFLVPGLFDLHVHPDDPEVWPLEPSEEARERLLPLFVANGVLTVRDMGGDLERLSSWRERIAAGELVGPRLVVCGPLVDGPEPMWPGSLAVADAAAGRRAVDELAAAGVDFVKVYSLLPPDAFRAVAARARELGLPIAGHVPRGVGVVEAAEAGMASQEHLLGVVRELCDPDALAERLAEIPDGLEGTARRNARIEAMLACQSEERTEALARRLAELGTVQVPTMILWKRRAWFDPDHPDVAPNLPYLPRYLREWWTPERNVHLRDLSEESMAGERALYRRCLEVLRVLVAAGVPVLPGTDTGGNPHLFPGFSVHDELAILVEAGMTPEQALLAATSGSARFLGLDDLGTVEPGKRADLVLLEADPLADVANTKRIAAVVRDGELLDRGRLDALLAELRDARD